MGQDGRPPSDIGNQLERSFFINPIHIQISFWNMIFTHFLSIVLEIGIFENRLPKTEFTEEESLTIQHFRLSKLSCDGNGALQLFASLSVCPWHVSADQLDFLSMELAVQAVPHGHDHSGSTCHCLPDKQLSTLNHQAYSYRLSESS